jgi:arylsulfatase A-like enzyme
MASLLHPGAGLFLAAFVVLSGAALAKPPNIVFILADDLDAASAAHMAHVKALITDQGASFQRHYVNVAICCPSRVTNLRGQFAHNSTIYSHKPPNGGFEGTYAKALESSTVATWLQDAGYRTALFGKYLNGYPKTAPLPTYIPPGWTEWASPIDSYAYSGFGYELNENGKAVKYGYADADYLTDVLSDKTVDFIRRSVQQYPDQPFFAYVAPYVPHLPATPAPRHADALPGITAPRTKAFNEVDVSDKPRWVRNLPLLTEAEIVAIDELYRKRRQSMLAIDDMVKRFIDTLRVLGELDNTYVLFTSDNGFHQGQHRMKPGKMTAFEEDMRVPLSARGPGVPAGTTINVLTSNADYAPTFAEIGGASSPSWVDGRSLVRLLHGQPPGPWRQAMMQSHGEFEEAGASESLHSDELADPFDTPVGLPLPRFTGLRTIDDLTYVAYDNGDREIYDNKQDPLQLRNRYETASDALKQRLAAWLAAIEGAAGEALRQAELRPPTPR